MNENLFYQTNRRANLMFWAISCVSIAVMLLKISAQYGLSSVKRTCPHLMLIQDVVLSD